MSLPSVRYGIIGFGLFAERVIAGAIQSSPNSKLVALHKRSLAAAEEKAKTFFVPHAFDSVHKLVTSPEVDAVFIASANASHCAETIEAARAGKHVLVEKPIALNSHEAEQMISECDRHGVKLMVGQIVRFSPVVLAMRDLVRSGELGHIISARADYLYDARLSKRTWLLDRSVAGGGPVFDIGVHCLDTLCFVLDDRVQSVHSHLAPPHGALETERTATLALRFSKGPLASIACSFEAPARSIDFEIIGTEGLARAIDFTLSSARITLDILHRSGKGEATKESRTFDVPDLCAQEVTAFSKCILENGESPVPGSVGLHNQRVLDLALRGGGEISYS